MNDQDNLLLIDNQPDFLGFETFDDIENTVEAVLRLIDRFRKKPVVVVDWKKEGF